MTTTRRAFLKAAAVGGVMGGCLKTEAKQETVGDPGTRDQYERERAALARWSEATNDPL